MVPEAPLEQTEHGLVPTGEGWFVLNAKDARWAHAEGRSAFCDFEGDQDFEQLGANVTFTDGRPALKPFDVQNVNGTRIGIIGATLESLPSVVAPGRSRPRQGRGGRRCSREPRTPGGSTSAGRAFRGATRGCRRSGGRS